MVPKGPTAPEGAKGIVPFADSLRRGEVAQVGEETGGDRLAHEAGEEAVPRGAVGLIQEAPPGLPRSGSSGKKKTRPVSAF